MKLQTTQYEVLCNLKIILIDRIFGNFKISDIFLCLLKRIEEIKAEIEHSPHYKIFFTYYLYKISYIYNL